MIVYSRHHYPVSVFEKIESQFPNTRVANILKMGDNWSAVLYRNGHQHDIVPIDPKDLIPPEPEKMIA